jgi:hypothetical protein
MAAEVRHPEQITADLLRAMLKLGLVDDDDFHKIIDELQIRLFTREISTTS